MKFGTREIAFLVVMLGLLGGAYFFGFSKSDARRLEKQAKIDAKLLALGELQQATANVQDVDKKIEELQKATSFFERKLPQAHEMDRVLKQVWKMAEKNGLQTRTVKTLKFEQRNGYREQPINVTLSGDFTGFYEFLLKLEALPRLTRVSQMALTKITDRDGEMQAQMTLSIFFDPKTDAEAKDASSAAAATAAAMPDDEE